MKGQAKRKIFRPQFAVLISLICTGWIISGDYTSLADEPQSGDVPVFTTPPSLVKDIWPGDDHALPAYLVEYQGVLFFTANDGIHGRELWRSDGTKSGTYLVKDILPGENGSGPKELAVANDLLFFVTRPGSGEP